MTDMLPAELELDIAGAGTEPAPVPLTEPREGVPTPVQTAARLAEVAAALAAGDGPVAVDAERASGYRYSQRAYLVQLRRAGAGTALIDPIALPDLSSIQQAIGGAEWVLHAANQDLACLAELGLAPRTLFDTELAGRLAGFARVGLGAMVENMLGLTLEKGHSAVDWSMRPLPGPWLRYAALDVEMLVELRAAMVDVLAAQGKLGLAEEEFAAVAAAAPPVPRTEPWRRTSGIHRLRTPHQLAGVRALWETRDEMARRRDIAPGRIVPDAALVAAVQAQPSTVAELTALPIFGGRHTRRHAQVWLDALHRAAALPDHALPHQAPPGDSPPPVHRWAERDLAAAGRLSRVRAALTALAERHTLPLENLLAPDAVRRLCWSPPPDTSPAGVARWLRGYGARSWQSGLTAEPLSRALGTG